MPEDRTQRIGLIVSAAGHLILIVWAAFGGIFFAPDPADPVATAEVSLMSSEEFAALQAAAPRAEVESPAAPSLPAADASEATPETPETETEAEPALPAEPEEQSEPDAAPDVTELAPPETEVTDTPPTPTTEPVVDPSPTVTEEISPSPKPREAPRVAPTPSEAPAPDAEVAEAVVEETTEAPAEEPLPEETEVAAAPPEATTEIVTEATETDEAPESSAPLASARPKSRPEKPAPAEPEAAPEPEPATETAAAEPVAEDAVADALAEALSGAASEEPAPGTGVADNGPPMTSGEKDALVVAVKQCWNVGALSTDALRTVVTLGVTMGQDGRPDAGSIRMIGFEGGDETAARQAFDAGRRAIMRCAGEGYDLPTEKFAQWREIEIVFNPEKMRMK